MAVKKKKPAPKKSLKPRWTIYILQCADGSFYTGITNDLEKRLKAHHAGTGAKYTRGRGPLTVVHTESRVSKGAALRREIAIKNLPRAGKQALLKPLV